MKDNFTEEFFRVIDLYSTRDEVAKELGNGKQTLNNWRSIGIPKGKRPACQFIVDRLTKEQEPTDTPKFQLYFEPDHAKFTRWCKAALSDEMTLEDWAFAVLESECDNYEAELEKITPLSRVAEDESEYSQRHEMDLLGAIAAGSGISGDHLDSVMLRNQYPSHYKAVKVIGDSMDDGSEISIADGCIAIVNPNWNGKPYAVKNKIYAWSIDSGQVLKKFVRRKVDGKTQGFLESLNPAFAPINYTEDMIPQGEFVAVECDK